ncbi:DUF4229 domain-containing protein [Williamsia muralis]|uniref:DUF4229 domain-containing protein n=1 Tax=Williamsia marianensis TaxID=85044 RepID=UPI001CB901E9|nr:DUF4229 domain-containing protein [Williamsia marianensis]
MSEQAAGAGTGPDGAGGSKNDKRGGRRAPSAKKTAPAVEPSPGAGRRLAFDLLAFTVARIALVIALAGGIYLLGRAVGVDVPILVAAFFAVIIALPLGMVLFRGLRDRVNVGIATVDAGRKAQRENLNARLRGEGRPESDGGSGSSSV